ncbi:MAG: Ldh family oxidoreductase [Hyphomicrobiaceae bacterium]
MTGLERIAVDDLEAIVTSAFEASNVAPANARSVACALTQAEVDGRKGHGWSRVPSYVAQARSGKVNGHATPSWEQKARSSAMIDVHHGFAYPAFDLAHEHLPALARETGIAAAAFTRSHHFGVAAHQVERFASDGLVALALGNTPKAMAPWGGTRPVFGTNPIAFAAPRRDAPPVVIDLALSTVARGNILKAAQAGKPIPEGWASDETGAPTTDASAALKGTLAPIGGAKGASLALMVEILAVTLTGANFAFEASSFFDGEGAPPSVGQLLIAIDPAAFASGDIFAGRMETLAAEILGQDGARLPGSRVIAMRETAKKDGINVDATLLAEVKALAVAG